MRNGWTWARGIATGLGLAIVAAGAVGCSSDGGDGEDTGASAEEALVAAPWARRVALGRMYVDGERTLLAYEGADHPSADVYGQRVGAKLARLQPTYVSGLIRINDTSASLTDDEVASYRAVRKLIPGAKFDIVISTRHGAHINSYAELEGLMKRLDAQVHPDIWYFDFFNKDQADPEIVHKAIAFGQDVQHKLVGGNFFDSAEKDTNGTGQADFFAVTDNANFELDEGRVRQLEALHHKTVVVHANNNPQDTSGEPASCRFMKDWSYEQRKDYVTRRASNQTQGRYRYMFNVFFPSCGRNADGAYEYYDAAHDHDGDMLDHMVALATN